MNKLESRLNDAYYHARCMLIDCGIDYGNIDEVKVNSRLTRVWGNCGYTKYASDWERCSYVINISSRLLSDDVSDNALMDTLIHEILHTCRGCMNHGGRWKKLASIVNAKFGLNIKRCTSSEEKHIKEDPIIYKYAVKCPRCGHVYKRVRMVDSIKNPGNYICACGHKGLVRIQ